MGTAFQISNKYMEQLCVGLNCTPNNLYYYTVSPTETIGNSHALAVLYRPTAANQKLLKKLEGMSPEQLDKFYEGVENGAF